ncbi:MAG: nicotinate phosphoribosyltransferase [Actinobacteria bacterium]|nr:nicotinate phosphoribosyltransferase [Actinomycetota bacterium]
MKSLFYTATDDEIKNGRTADVYFQRAFEIIKKEGMDRRARSEIILKKFNDGGSWGVLAGMEEALNLLEGVNVNVECMQEGAVFRTWEPVMTIDGMYCDYCVYETALLGLLCQASGIATKAARCRIAAGEKLMISFGARRMHPAISPMIDKNAYIGGCDGVSVIKSAELLGVEPTGTIPHALIIIYGDTVKAAQAFNEIIDKKVKRVILIDTFNDEKFEALRVAKTLGDDLFAVRLDTPSSRRGDFKQLIKEIRWELDLRGFKDVKIFVSGGLNEKSIAELVDVADAFGVGTSISSAPVLDFALDIVEVDGEPIAKRGKSSGVKAVLRCSECHNDRVVPYDVSLYDRFGFSSKQKEDLRCDCSGDLLELLDVAISDGRLLRPYCSHSETREFVLSQLQWAKNI